MKKALKDVVVSRLRNHHFTGRSLIFPNLREDIRIQASLTLLRADAPEAVFRRFSYFAFGAHGNKGILYIY